MERVLKPISKAVIVLFIVLSATVVFAAPPANFQSTELVGSNLINPTGFGLAPDGRIFILEQGGAVKIYKNGALLSTPFTTFSTETQWDAGLLGIAFDPSFSTNQYVYFYY